MPRPRLPRNRGLPARWHQRHGAYYYRVPPGLEAAWDGRQWFRLGATLPEAFRVFAARVETAGQARTIGELLDRYALQVVPTKAPKTQASNVFALAKLRAVFGHMPLLPFPPRLVYQYVEKRQAKIAAHREIEVLSHAYTKAVEWGFVDRHPFKGQVRLTGEKPRQRYVEDWEIVECLSLPARRHKGSVAAVKAYLRLKLLTGLRRGDLLRLKTSDLTDEGIAVRTHKTGKSVVYLWTDELRRAVADARQARPVDISPWLFCNKRGEGYVDEQTGEAAGFKSIWQRFMARVIAETQVTEHFTEHDLRAKVGSDAESLARARALLAHVDDRTTQRVYRRKPERVKPAR